MLKTLTVWNFALLEHVEINFDAGLNILTGETGAGKSILIDALGAVLARCDTGCPPAVPVLMPGERIDAAALEALQYYGVDRVSVL